MVINKNKYNVLVHAVLFKKLFNTVIELFLIERSMDILARRKLNAL